MSEYPFNVFFMFPFNSSLSEPVTSKSYKSLVNSTLAYTLYLT